MEYLTKELIQKSIEEGLIIHKFISPEEVRANKDGSYTFLMSKEIQDRDGTIVKLGAGMNIREYNKNPIVLWMHKMTPAHREDYNEDNIIGKGKAYMEGGELYNKVIFESVETTGNTRAEKIVKKINFGSLKGCSMGFRALSGSMGSKDVEGEDPSKFYIRDWVLYEMSIVTVPSNPATLVRMEEEPTPPTEKTPDLQEEKVLEEAPEDIQEEKVLEEAPEDIQEEKQGDEGTPEFTRLARAKRNLLTHKFKN